MRHADRTDGKRKSKGAYMTLEASLLMPVIVVLCVFTMLLSFYLYTTAFLNQAAYIAALRGSLTEEGDPAAVTEAELSRLLEERILPVRNPDREISVTGTSVRVVLEAEISLPVSGILPVETQIWRIRADKKAFFRDAAAFIRGVRRVSGALE